MLQETRLQRIRTLLTHARQLSTERIISELGISRETARRDMIALEDQGLARRVHGGLVSAEQGVEPPLTVRSAVRSKEKQAIAQAATPLILPGQTLFIDGGSTTTLLAQALRRLTGLTIITNSLQVALKLSEGEEQRPLENQIVLLGGAMGAGAQATHGEQTVHEIQRYRADVALLSPVGIDATGGITSYHPHEAAIARAMMNQAARCVILADHSKLGVISRLRWATCEQVDVLVTDSHAATSEAFSALQRSLREIVRA